MPTAEEAAQQNALYRAMNGLPADPLNTQILSTPAGVAYQQSYQQQLDREDAAREQAKYVAAFSQPRNDNVAPSQAFLDINAAYAAQRGNVVSSSGTYAQGSFAPTVATGGPSTGRAAEYAAGWSPLTPSKYSQELSNQPSRSTVPTRDLSSGMSDSILSSLPGQGTVTAYTPYGDRAQTELEKVKIGYGAAGEVGFYQQPYGHSIYSL